MTLSPFIIRPDADFGNTEVILSDLDSRGKERPWIKLRIQNEEVSEAFRELGNETKAKHIEECSPTLEFFEDPSTGAKKLKRAFFCRDRCCPICNWRKYLVLRHQLGRVIPEASKRQTFNWFMLTLTTKRVHPWELSNAVDKLLKAFPVLMKDKRVKKLVVGWFRAVEFTFDLKTSTFDVHIHVTIAANRSHKYYIKNDEWRRIWHKALDVDFIPIVEIVRPTHKRSTVFDDLMYLEALSMAQYSVKPRSDFLHALNYYDQAIRGRRLYAYGGTLRKVLSELRAAKKIADEEKGDYIHLNDESELEVRENKSVVLYEWDKTLRRYIAVSSRSIV